MAELMNSVKAMEEKLVRLEREMSLVTRLTQELSEVGDDAWAWGCLVGHKTNSPNSCAWALMAFYNYNMPWLSPLDISNFCLYVGKSLSEGPRKKAVAYCTLREHEAFYFFFSEALVLID